MPEQQAKPDIVTPPGLPLERHIKLSNGEIMSYRMGAQIIQLWKSGCTDDCIPCHFREAWHREIDTESVQAVLEEDFTTTEQFLVHGETLVHRKQISNREGGWTKIPDGVIADVQALLKDQTWYESDVICMHLMLKYKAMADWLVLDIFHIEEIADMSDRMWTTDRFGHPIDNSRMHYEPSGHRIGSLPTTPVTPRNNGRPRSSHRTPPPQYSPARANHPARVLAPLALLERQQLPPSYVDGRPPPPAFSEVIVARRPESGVPGSPNALWWVDVTPVVPRAPQHRPQSLSLETLGLSGQDPTRALPVLDSPPPAIVNIPGAPQRQARSRYFGAVNVPVQTPTRSSPAMDFPTPAPVSVPRDSQEASIHAPQNFFFPTTGPRQPFSHGLPEGEYPSDDGGGDV